MSDLRGNSRVGGYLVTTLGNLILQLLRQDGHGSGIDACKWDGNQFSDYLNQAVRTTDSPIFSKLTLSGSNPQRLLLKPSTNTLNYITFLSYNQTKNVNVGMSYLSNPYFFIYQPNNADIKFYTSGSLRMTISGSGNVGIGTNYPRTLLDVRGVGACIGDTGYYGNLTLVLDKYSGNTVFTLRRNAIGAMNFTLRGDGTRNGSLDISNDNGTLLTTMTGGGRIGIGTTSSTGLVNIQGFGYNYGGLLRLFNNDADKWGCITLPDDISATNDTNHYLIGRGNAISDRVLSIHIPNASNYGSGNQPKLGIFSTGADLLMTVLASTGTVTYKNKYYMKVTESGFAIGRST